jgi:hypothetical protein
MLQSVSHNHSYKSKSTALSGTPQHIRTADIPETPDPKRAMGGSRIF